MDVLNYNLANHSNEICHPASDSTLSYHRLANICTDKAV